MKRALRVSSSILPNSSTRIRRRPFFSVFSCNFSSSDSPSNFGSRDNSTPPSIDQVAAVKQLSEQIAKDVAAGVEEMKSNFGEKHAEKVWMMDYYKHGSSKYIVPAFSMLIEDERMHQLPSIAMKNAVFFSSVLRLLSPEKQSQYIATMALTKNLQLPYLLSIMQLQKVNDQSPVSKQMMERINLSMKSANATESLEQGRWITSTPSISVLDWTFPIEDSAFLSGKWSNTENGKNFPFEVLPVFKKAKEMLAFHDYLLLACTTYLESQWASFYATGDHKYLSKIAHVGSFWSEFSHLDDSIQYLLQLDIALPSDLVQKSEDQSVAIRNTKAHISRVALWSLLMHARKHEGVVEMLSDEIKKLSPFFVDSPSLDESPVSIERLTARAEVYPSLLHLIARAKLDSK
jgi:hypothetical protein